MAATGRIPGIPRWVGSSMTLSPLPKTTPGDPLNVHVSVHIPPVRGFIYGAWRILTRRTAT